MKIIINADDFGMTKSVNKAILELMKLGTVTSTTVMVNMPYAEEARQLLEIPNISVGLHFNLTEGKPVSDPSKVKSLIDKNEMFYNKKELEGRAKKNLINKDEVLLELKNQYNKLFFILGSKISHFDSHQGLNRIPVVFRALLDFGKEQQRPAAIRFYVKYYILSNGTILKPGFYNFMKFGIKRLLVELYLVNNKKQINKYFKSPDGMLVSESLQSVSVLKVLAEHADVDYKNKIMEIPCHPAVDTSELENTKLVNERVAEYEFLKSDAFVKASKIAKFVSFKDVIV